MTTVVLKLFNLAQPTVAFFGQKDYQQCAVIERMVRDLDLPIEIVRGETIREPDGLAMSSRNAYLKPEDRARAPKIHQALTRVRDAYRSGERSAARLAEIGRAALAEDAAFDVQYFEVRDPRSLAALDRVGDAGAVALVAAFLGGTRLIDNLVL